VRASDSPSPASGDALLVVDVQRDFLPGGALGVPEGDVVVPVINRWIERFRARELPVFASRDWHPADHCSFAAQGGHWPPHCVADTPGADFCTDLSLPPGVEVISKARESDKDAYSAFSGTDLARRLADLGVKRLFVGGLATDYCVRASVLDALRAGFDVVLLVDAVRAVNANPGDGAEALEEMRAAGARILREPN
jgi:nicotinamidase/pyrazinamidase